MTNMSKIAYLESLEAKSQQKANYIQVQIPAVSLNDVSITGVDQLNF